MKTMNRKQITLILAGVFAVTAPAFASGPDDGTSGHDGDDVSALVFKGKNSAKVRGKFNPLITTTKVRGKFEDVMKKGGAREQMEIKFKIGKTGPVDDNNFNTGVLRATFQTGDPNTTTVCELEPDNTPSVRFYEYSLKLRERNGQYKEKDGFCEIPVGTAATAIPAFAGVPINVEFDVDGDPATPDDNTAIATGTF